jgi:hypothetical protein
VCYSGLWSVWISEQLCKIWGSYSGDYEECHLLGYKDPVHTSQETHYVSATQSSQLMLCKIWGFCSTDYEECHLLGYDAMQLLQEPTFQRNVSLSSSGRKWSENCSMLHVPSLLIIFTLKIEAIHSSEMSVLTRTTIHNIQIPILTMEIYWYNL